MAADSQNRYLCNIGSTKASLGWETYTSKHLLAVELLSSVKRIIDEGEASGSATTELGLETENRNVLILGLEGLSKLALDVGLRDVGQLGVNQFDHLLEI